MGKGVTTTREALMAELLGDVSDLMDRLEALSSALPESVEAAASTLKQATQGAGDDIKMSRTEVVKACDLLQKAITKEAKNRDVTAAALEQTLGRHTSRIMWLAVSIAALVGFLGGAVGALALPSIL